MNRYQLFAGVAAAVAALDLATKAWVEARLLPFESVEVIPGFFHLTYVKNLGAAFGLFADSGSIRTPLFIGVSLLAMAAIVWLVRKLEPSDRFSALMLAFIFGGALGNLVDRIRYGAVVDFLDVFWKTHHWPAFNVADAAICVGVGGLLVSEFFLAKKRA